MKPTWHDGVQTLQSQLASELKALLTEVPVGAEFVVAPASDFCASLELFVPRLLSRRHPEWAHESLDGVFAARARRTGAETVELVGTCILMSDQTVTPLLVELVLSNADVSIESFRICVGEPGGGALAISGPDCNSQKAKGLLAAVASRRSAIPWSYEVRSSEI